MQSIWEKKTCFWKSVSLSEPFSSKRHLFEVIRSHEMQLMVFVKEQFLQTSLQINFFLYKNDLKRKVSFMQAFKYVKRVILSDDMSSHDISSWPFDMQTFWISVKHFTAQHTTKAEFEDKPAPIGIFPATNKFIPMVFSRPYDS